MVTVSPGVQPLPVSVTVSPGAYSGRSLAIVATACALTSTASGSVASRACPTSSGQEEGKDEEQQTRRRRA